MAIQTTGVAGAVNVTFEAEFDNGNSGAAKTIDWNNGQKQKVTLTATCTFTFTPLAAGVANLLLKLVQDGTGSRDVVWPASVKWRNGVAPNLSNAAGAVDIVSLYFDGTNYYGTSTTNFQ